MKYDVNSTFCWATVSSQGWCSLVVSAMVLSSYGYRFASRLCQEGQQTTVKPFICCGYPCRIEPPKEQQHDLPVFVFHLSWVYSWFTSCCSSDSFGSQTKTYYGRSMHSYNTRVVVLSLSDHPTGLHWSSMIMLCSGVYVWGCLHTGGHLNNTKHFLSWPNRTNQLFSNLVFFSQIKANMCIRDS